MYIYFLFYLIFYYAGQSPFLIQYLERVVELILQEKNKNFKHMDQPWTQNGSRFCLHLYGKSRIAILNLSVQKPLAWKRYMLYSLSGI